MTPEQLAELFVEEQCDNTMNIHTCIEILIKQAYKEGYERAVNKTEEWLENNAYLYVDDIDQLHESALIADFRHAMTEI